MNKDTWTFIFFYGSVVIGVIIFIVLVNKKRLKELIPVGLLIAAENYTVETIGLHKKVWKYPLDNPGYPEVVIISSLIYFPLLAMIFYQYLTKNTLKNIFLICGFVIFNMIIEIITLKTTNLFVYGENMNLFIAALMYTGAYILIILFRHFYTKLS